MTLTDRRTFLLQSAKTLAGVAILPEWSLAQTPNPAASSSVAVIGLGRQGRAIIGELQKIGTAGVTALCDTDPARLKSALSRAPGARTYDSHAELLEREPGISGVLVATPTHLHRAIVIDALAAGRNVYCEAPLAHTVEDTEAIAQAARTARGIFQAGLEGRSNPIYKLARTFFKTEAVRDLVSIYAQNQRKTSWRVAATDPARDAASNWRLDAELSLGLPGELGTHQFDVVHWYTGKLPQLVRGGGAVRFYQDGRKVADTVRLHFAYAGGVEFAYHATLASSFGGTHEIFHGSNSAIKLAWTHGWMFKEADAPTQGWEVYANRQQFHNDEGITLIAEATQLAAQGKLKEGVGLPHSPLYYALEDFLAGVAAGKTQGAGIEEGRTATLLGIAAQRSVVTGQEQQLASWWSRGE